MSALRARMIEDMKLGRLGGHNPADLPPGGEVFGEALQ